VGATDSTGRRTGRLLQSRAGRGTLDTIRCARCGTRVTSQAPRCPECGADPHSGQASIKRGELDRVRVCQGVWVRAQALLVDCLLLVAVWLLVALVWYLALVGAGSFADITKAPSSAPLWLLAAVGAPLYFWLGPAVWGRTLGMRAFGLRVVTLDGRRPGVAATLARTLLLAVDWLPAFFVLGALLIRLTPRRQRLGDIAARTAVVRSTLVSAERIETGGLPVVPWHAEAA
jgi:uncharacterized RDD family membrane protein YckC